MPDGVEISAIRAADGDQVVALARLYRAWHDEDREPRSEPDPGYERSFAAWFGGEQRATLESRRRRVARTRRTALGRHTPAIPTGCVMGLPPRVHRTTHPRHPHGVCHGSRFQKRCAHLTGPCGPLVLG